MPTNITLDRLTRPQVEGLRAYSPDITRESAIRRAAGRYGRFGNEPASSTVRKLREYGLVIQPPGKYELVLTEHGQRLLIASGFRPQTEAYWAALEAYYRLERDLGGTAERVVQAIGFTAYGDERKTVDAPTPGLTAAELVLDAEIRAELRSALAKQEQLCQQLKARIHEAWLAARALYTVQGWEGGAA